MTGSGNDDESSSRDDEDPLEEVLGDETLSGPDETLDESDDLEPAEKFSQETETGENESDPAGTSSRGQNDTSERGQPPSRGSESRDQWGPIDESEQSQHDQSHHQNQAQHNQSAQPQNRRTHHDNRQTRKQDQRPPPVGSDGQPRSEPASNESTGEWVLFVKDIVTTVLAVMLLGGYLFAVSGIWPPMVAIESESMAPNMNVDDLVFLMENERFQPDEAQAGTGVVTAQTGTETGYSNYGNSGDVIVFNPDGNERATPIIHRAMFWVEEGENWCEQANPEYLGRLSPSNADCVADNAGFITKGDNNNNYDQAATQAENPVKPEWIIGTAELRIPRLGWFRLQFQ